MQSVILDKNPKHNILEIYSGLLINFHHTLSLYNFDAGAVYLPSDENIFELVYSVGFPPEYTENIHTVTKGVGFGGTTLALRSVRISEDTEDDPRIIRPVVFKSGFKSFISVPLLAGENIMGLFNFGYHESMKFTLEQREALSLLGNILGLYLKDHINLRISTEQERQIKKMYVLGTELFRIHDMNSICNIALEESMVLMNAVCAFIILKPSNEVFSKGIIKCDELFTPELIKALNPNTKTKPVIIDRSTSTKPVLIGFLDTYHLERLYLIHLGLDDMPMAVLAFGQKRNQHKFFDLITLTQISNNLSVAMSRYLYNKKAQDHAVVKEYSRISREMHDSLAQQVSAISNKLEFIKRLNTEEQIIPAPVLAEIQECQELVKLTIHCVRDSILDLRLLTTEEGNSFNDIVSKYLNSFAHNHPDIKFDIEIGSLECHVPMNIQIQLFRIIQESLTNTQKHSKASCASISITQEQNHLIIKISDNGKGFDDKKQTSGFGLSVMRERAEEIGANLEITSSPNQGTQITVFVEL